MKLHPIHYATLGISAPRKVIVMPNGNALTHNNRFERMLWSRHTLAEVQANHEREAQKTDAERYAEAWVLAA